ncbi:hypothetical protein JCM19538_2752 [Jejuia pallidilutea]|uniref:Uncharacterized protein n=1 Tax=Jejuia pallidilutea TaxID=504487 RepID=A0A098LXQ6_9FLAO|nr:hypothetical protein JCM19538_2752 [Jejuia pallidilutea]
MVFKIQIYLKFTTFYHSLPLLLINFRLRAFIYGFLDHFNKSKTSLSSN